MAQVQDNKSKKSCIKSGEDKSKGGCVATKHVYSTNQATVEVTVKLKKRKSEGIRPPGLDTVPSAPYRKGSWADLLSQNKAVDLQDVLSGKETKGGKQQEKSPRCTFPDLCHRPESNCHKIPITEDLYLETHTHVNSPCSQHLGLPNGGYVIQPVKKMNTSSKRQNLAIVKENEGLRKEIRYLKKEIERKERLGKSERNNKVLKESSEQIYQIDKRGVIMNTPPTRMGRQDVAVETTREDTEIDGRRRDVEKSVQVNPEVVNSLAMENAALRREAEQLLEQMSKTQIDQQEYISTINELYQLAEVLKNENQELLGTNEQQQLLQKKLMETLSENHLLKQHLEQLYEKQKKENISGKIDADKMRMVLREVKTTIAEEIQGIQKQSAMRESLSTGFDVRVEQQVSALLNDTNASEIQRILRTQPSFYPSEDRESSTQYLSMPNAVASSKEGIFIPSPHGSPNFSPRISTPMSDESSSSSKVGRHSVPLTTAGDGDFSRRDGAYNKMVNHPREISQQGYLRNEREVLRDYSSTPRSFMPLQTELIVVDSSTTCEYRSTTSSRSSVNNFHHQ